MTTIVPQRHFLASLQWKKLVTPRAFIPFLVGAFLVAAALAQQYAARETDHGFALSDPRNSLLGFLFVIIASLAFGWMIQRRIGFELTLLGAGACFVPLLEGANTVVVPVCDGCAEAHALPMVVCSWMAAQLFLLALHGIRETRSGSQPRTENGGWLSRFRRVPPIIRVGLPVVAKLFGLFAALFLVRRWGPWTEYFHDYRFLASTTYSASIWPETIAMAIYRLVLTGRWFLIVSVGLCLTTCCLIIANHNPAKWVIALRTVFAGTCPLFVFVFVTLFTPRYATIMCGLW